jgi:Holliday junction resolvase RusA-like endonuclease
VKSKFTFIALDVEPVPKPRMTVRDKWKKRPVVMRYREFCDALRLAALRAGYEVRPPLSIRFEIAMPDSWSKKKKNEMRGQPHLSTPDLDNLIKAFKDALCENDSYVWCYNRMEKIWADHGRIIVVQEVPDGMPPLRK